MPAPLVPAKLEFREGIPYSGEFGDVYHNAGGGIAKKRHVFLAGNGLPERWAGRRRFVILETGFGLGLNFLVTLQAWRRDPRRCERLHFVSVEKHPFTLPDLRLAHERYPELAEEAALLHERWPALVGGVHRLDFDNQVILTVAFSDIAMLRELRLQADAVYLDGFSPAMNAAMWSPQVVRAISRLCARDATAATWSVAGPVRRALEEVGFAVEKRPGYGNKREMLVARFLKGNESLQKVSRRAAVVGAGLAGAALCERLCARGWEVDLYERHGAAAQEASGNRAGAFHPVVTPDDSLFARLTRAGFLASLSTWKALQGLRWDPCGLLQLSRDAKEESAQRRAVEGLPAEYARYVTREEASRHAGVPLAAGGVWFAQAGWIDPRSLVQAQLDACGNLLTRRFGQEVKALPSAPVVILANSGAAPALCPVPALRLRRVRGQLTHVPAGEIDAPRVVVLRGGMVLPPVDGTCIVGASYDIDDDDAELRADSHEGNLERLQRILSVAVDAPSLDGRVAFRSVTPDRLPVVGRIADGVYGAFAYGSRGLVWAALAAEIIASALDAEPAPVEASLLAALDPGRFRRRAESRGLLP